MMITKGVLLVGAIICFVLDVAIESKRLNLQSIGLACLTAAFLVPVK